MATTTSVTTLVPTSLVPTTLVTTPGPTTAPPHFDRNPLLDQTILVGSINISVTVSGGQFNVCLALAPINISIGPTLTIVLGVILPGGSVDIAIVPFSSYVTLEGMRKNWVKWSKIGYLDFTLDHSNVAGERPVDWKGWVYGIRKLGNKIVVYGENGVTVLEPKDVNIGMTTIYRIGLESKSAVAGDDSINFFVDKEHRLFKLDTKVTLLDYSEYLSSLSGIVLSYDKRKELLYVCDGTNGYIYGARTESFGKGPANITGIDSQSGTLYVAAPASIVTPKFEICTDIYDFGTRKPKTIEVFEVGSDLTNDLYSSVDYRKSYRDPFTQIDWFLVNPDGRSFPKCYGVEFRFRLKSYIREYFEIDYFKFKGFIHGFSPLDTTSSLANLFQSKK